MTGRGRIFRTGSAWKGAFPDWIKATRARARINRKGEEGRAEEAAVGNTKGKYTKISMTSDTDVGDPEQFKDLVVKESDGSLIRLRDIARVELGSETYDQLALYKGQPATYVAIELSPGANPLTVAKLVKDELPGIESQLPSGMNVRLAYDASDFIDSSIKETAGGAGYRSGGGLHLPGLSQGSRGSVRGGASVSGWRRLFHADDGLLTEPADTAVDGTRHRSCRGRRDHHGGKRPPPH